MTLAASIHQAIRTALSEALDLASGAGDGQADWVFADSRTLAASASEEIDLARTLVDESGSTIAFTKVRGLFVFAASENTNNVVVGGASANQFVGPFGAAVHTVAVGPSGVFAAVNMTGWTVTAGTGDLLKIANSSGCTSVTYDVVIVGTSA